MIRNLTYAGCIFIGIDAGRRSRDGSNISRIASFPLLFYFLFYAAYLTAHEVPARRASRLRGKVLTTAFPEWSTVDSYSRPPAHGSAEAERFVRQQSLHSTGSPITAPAQLRQSN